MAKRNRKKLAADVVAKLNASIDEKITSHGWAVMGIFADPATNTPTFSYTVGLTEQGKPELIVMGMRPENALHVINNVARRLIDGEIKPHERLARVLGDGYEPVLIEADVSRAREFLRAAVHRYGDRTTALQLVLPDSENRLPWDEGYNAEQMRGVQILLTS